MQNNTLLVDLGIFRCLSQYICKNIEINMQKHIKSYKQGCFLVLVWNKYFIRKLCYMYVLRTEKLWIIYYLDDLKDIYTFWILFFYLSEGIGKSLYIDNINKR
jgi:hypothetical protein